MGGQAGIVRILLKCGMSPNAYGARGSYGYPLHAAADSGNTAAVMALLEGGADANLEDSTESNTNYPIATALYSLCCSAQYDNGEEEEQSLLPSRQDILGRLLEYGADIDARGGEYGTPLHAAAHYGVWGLVKILLERGASINIVNGKYGTALQAAVAGGRRNMRNICETLLRYGADPNIFGGLLGTALQTASYYQCNEVVELLLDHGADVNMQGGLFANALQAACVHRALSFAERSKGKIVR
jgi:ankyrin repeat protein